eukprot:768242-Hanusia_phi.AAC.1
MPGPGDPPGQPESPAGLRHKSPGPGSAFSEAQESPGARSALGGGAAASPISGHTDGGPGGGRRHGTAAAAQPGPDWAQPLIGPATVRYSGTS